MDTYLSWSHTQCTGLGRDDQTLVDVLQDCLLLLEDDLLQLLLILKQRNKSKIRHQLHLKRRETKDDPRSAHY
jgi:hypothetical protein